jgi:hypothetical protein
MRARRWLGSLTATTLLVLGSGPGAHAGDQQAPPDSTGGTVVQPVANCVIFHSTQEFGKDCTDTVIGPPIKVLLGGKPLNPCLYVLADPTVQALMALEHPSPPEQPGKAYLKTCINGINVDLPAALQRNLTETISYQWVYDNDVQNVTDPGPTGALFTRLVGDYPPPVLDYGPALPLRVNINDYVWLTDDSRRTPTIGINGRNIGNVPGVANVTMWAQLDTGDPANPAVQILPGTQVAGKDVTIDCDGTTQWQPTHDLAVDNAKLDAPPPGACVLRYTAGSVNESNPVDHGSPTYNVTVTSRFRVFYQVDNGAPTAMPGTVTKTSQIAVPVDEIQTLNR